MRPAADSPAAEEKQPERSAVMTVALPAPVSPQPAKSSPSQVPPPDNEIVIHIGHIEVKPPAPAPVPMSPGKRRTPPPLDEYLRRRNAT